MTSSNDSEVGFIYDQKTGKWNPREVTAPCPRPLKVFEGSWTEHPLTCDLCNGTQRVSTTAAAAYMQEFPLNQWVFDLVFDGFLFILIMVIVIGGSKGPPKVAQ